MSLTPHEEMLAWEKRRRGRNWAIMLSLIGLAVLFFFVTVAKMTKGG